MPTDRATLEEAERITALLEPTIKAALPKGWQGYALVYVLESSDGQANDGIVHTRTNMTHAALTQIGRDYAEKIPRGDLRA